MVVFVSPHFDDAIGSCGCLIHRLALTGEEVQVLTIFAGQHAETVSAFAKWIIDGWRLTNGVTERLQENRQACQIVGAKDSYLGFPEALYRKGRNWLYPDGRALFGPVHEEDLHLPEVIAKVLMERYDRDTLFYFPSARGTHVDHVIVRHSGEILASNGFRVWLYSDFSYSGEPLGSLNLRREVRYFDIDDLSVKIRAVNAYTSQLEMLFHATDSSEYFVKENGAEYGKVTEVYYEIVNAE